MHQDTVSAACAVYFVFCVLEGGLLAMGQLDTVDIEVYQVRNAPKHALFNIIICALCMGRRGPLATCQLIQST